MRIGPFSITRSGATANRRGYDAARVSRLTADWIYSHQSADKEIKVALERVRARARDLERNSDYARRYLSLVESNIVGKAGFSLRLDVPETLAVNAEKVRAAFAAWIDRADVSGQHDGAGLERLIVRSAARDGESLALIRRGGTLPDGIGLRVVESDYLSIRNEDLRDGLGVGVHVDADGRPVSYWLYEKHPGDDYAGKTIEYAAKDLIHVFRMERPGQRRAVSWLSPAMLPLKMLAGYQEAELVASRTAACQMGFYKLPPGNDFGGDGKDAQGNPVTDAAPGMFERLPSGWDFVPYDPKHPTTQYGLFIKSILREISAGLGVSYASLANDGSDANYSSMREMSILERENWMVLQAWFARLFMSRVYREWLPSAADFGSLKGIDVAPFLTADRWTGKTWPWVDPEKDANAREADVRNRLTAPSLLAAEKGLSYPEMCKLAARDEALRDKETAAAYAAAGITPAAKENPA